MTLNVAHAVSRNHSWADRLAWRHHYLKIAEALGARLSSTPEQFVRAVYDWQHAQPGLKPDGIIGPNTWGAIRRVLGWTHGERGEGYVDVQRDNPTLRALLYNFDVNSADLKVQHYEFVNNYVAKRGRESNTYIMLLGLASNTGSFSANERLAEARARTIALTLEHAGVAPAKTAIYWGTADKLDSRSHDVEDARWRAVGIGTVARFFPEPPSVDDFFKRLPEPGEIRQDVERLVRRSYAGQAKPAPGSGDITEEELKFIENIQGYLMGLKVIIRDGHYLNPDAAGPRGRMFSPFQQPGLRRVIDEWKLLGRLWPQKPSDRQRIIRTKHGEYLIRQVKQLYHQEKESIRPHRK